jgi:hypothetical protein
VKNYAQIDAVNFSSLKHLDESPASYLWHLANPVEATPVMEFGTAFHMAILEPEKFAETYVRAQDGMKFSTTDGKAWKAAAESRGLSILSQSDWRRIESMGDAFVSHPEIAPFLEAPGKPEHILTWTDAETGIGCKGRLDRLLDDGRIFGVKTTQKFGARQFQSHAWELCYHAQWAFYYDGAVANGLDVPEVAEGVSQTQGPFDAALYIVPAHILERGRETYRGWLRTLAECKASGRWGGRYPNRIEFAAPGWAQSQDEKGDLAASLFAERLAAMAGE